MTHAHEMRPPVTLGLIAALLLSLLVSVGAVSAAPTKQDTATISSSAGNSNIVPFGSNQVTITFNGGTNNAVPPQNNPVTVCFVYSGGGGAIGGGGALPSPGLFSVGGAIRLDANGTAQRLFAQGSGNTSSTFTGVNQSGLYSFLMYAGTLSTCPDPATAIQRLDLTKANPLPGGGSGSGFAASTGTALALIVPSNPVTGTAACPAPQAGAAGGAFTGSPIAPAPFTSAANPAGGSGQYVGYLQDSGPVPIDGKDFVITGNTTLPRTLCVAFDAGYKPDNTPRPEVMVFVSVNNSSPLGPLARGPFGYVQFNAVVSGSYRFTEYDVTAAGTVGAPITAENCTSTFAVFATANGPCDETVSTAFGIKTSAASYTGGTAAIVPFVYDSGAVPTAPSPVNQAGGNPTLVCVGGQPTGPFSAVLGLGQIASYSNDGALVTSVSGLPPSETPYTLTIVVVTFTTGPNAIANASGPCAPESVTNSVGANPTASPAGFSPYPAGSGGFPYASVSNGKTTFTINP